MIEIAGGIILAVLVLLFWRGIVLLGVAAIGLAILGLAVFLLYHGLAAMPDAIWTWLSYGLGIVVVALVALAPLYVLYAIAAAVWNIATWRPLAVWKRAATKDLAEQ